MDGTILEFRLPSALGYGYCKIIDFRHIREFDGVLVKVFDYIAQDPIKDIDDLRTCDYLFGARRMPWLPGTRGKGAWKRKGILISQDDFVIPDFKYCMKSSGFEMDQSTIGPWDIVRNINTYIPAEYASVKHLEDTIVSPRPAIEIRTGMEYLRQQKKPIDHYFSLDKKLNALVYNQMNSVPVYKSIPKNMRGKALE